MTASELRELVEAYLERFPDSRDRLKLLLDQLSRGDRLDDRDNFTGHITAAGLVLSPDKRRILLIHHKLFDTWLQPGGHWEPDEEATPLDAARREVAEETGVNELTYLPFDPEVPLLPFDIDTHHVSGQPRRHEPPHYHHDFRYAFVARNETLSHQDEEVNAAGWFAFDSEEAANIRRLINKLRAAQVV